MNLQVCAGKEPLGIVYGSHSCTPNYFGVEGTVLNEGIVHGRVKLEEMGGYGPVVFDGDHTLDKRNLPSLSA